MSARVPSAVATLPAISSKPGKFFRVSRTASITPLRVAVRRVHDDHVHAGLEQRVDALLAVRGRRPPRRRTSSRPLASFAALRVRPALLDVLDGDEAAELDLLVHDQELLDAVLCSSSMRLALADALAAR